MPFVAFPSVRSTWSSTSAAVGDPSATRTVYITVVLLAALGVAMVALAVWLFRRTRPEPQLLAPLEEMETRSWRKQDPAAQRRALDASRPPGARPVRREAAEPLVDAEFGPTRPVVGFDDLADRPGRLLTDPTGPIGGIGADTRDPADSDTAADDAPEAFDPPEGDAVDGHRDPDPTADLDPDIPSTPDGTAVAASDDADIEIPASDADPAVDRDDTGEIETGGDAPAADGVESAPAHTREAVVEAVDGGRPGRVD